MSSSRALCCLPSVKKQNMTLFFVVQCIIKRLLDSGFVISRIIDVSVWVISLSLRLRLITPTSTSIILDITKTSSNNCLKLTGSKITGALRNTRKVYGDLPGDLPCPIIYPIFRETGRRSNVALHMRRIEC